MARTASRLQLAFELVQEAPIGASAMIFLGLDLIMPDLVQPQRIEPHRVLGIVLAPFVVGHLAQRLERIVVAAVKPPSTMRRATRAGSLAQRSAALRIGAHDAFGRDRMLPDELRLPASMQQKYCDQGGPWRC